MTKQVLGVIGPLDERYYNTHENFVHCLVAQERGYVNYVCADSVVHHWVGQSGPARFARVEEDDALFWAEWASRRRVDLGTSLDESLDHALGAHPEMADYAFEPIRLCRSQDESILLERIEQQWPGASQRLHDTRIFNSAHEKLWLPMELPFRAMMSPAPYIYIVDRISQLAENRLWFEARKRIVTTEMIVDARAVVVTSDELLRLFGGPL
jgi:hypothetical protein